jgi:hypothetical protein
VKPFARHYDLELHFRTVHSTRNELRQFNCDYSKCPHQDNFLRKDHYREHLREYHMEDLLKRGYTTKKTRELLESRNSHVSKLWWRCSRCLRRVKTEIDGYECSECKLPCEPERVAWREEAFRGTNEDRTSYNAISWPKSDIAMSDSPRAFCSDNSTSLGYVACGQCQNTWLPDDSDPTGQAWLPCPTCQPGATDAVLY